MKLSVLIFFSSLLGAVAQRNGGGGNGGGGNGGGGNGGVIDVGPLPDVFTSAEEIITFADARIRAAMARNRRLAANVLRLAFHDCVPNGVAGGCDGCVNLSNPANNGLLPALQALAPIVAELENDDFGISRADIWAYAALVAADVSQNNLVFTDEFSIGRQNCETVGTCSSTDPLVCATSGPDQFGDFPSNDLTTHQLLDFMDEHFGFNADETVAIMGAHTIGRALPQNSGIQGQNGWSNNVFSLGKSLTYSICMSLKRR
jgi:hypothetical protein